MTTPTTGERLRASVDAWVPQDLDPLDRADATLFVQGAVSTAGCVVLGYLIVVVAGHASAPLHLGAGVSLAMLGLSVMMLWATRSLVAAVNVAVGSAFGGTLGVLLLSQPHMHPAATLLLAEALVAAWFLDHRWRTFWMVMVAGGYAILVAPEFLSVDVPAVLTLPTTPALWLVVQVCLLVQVAGMLQLFESTHRRDSDAAVKLRAERDVARARNRELKGRNDSISTELVHVHQRLQESLESKRGAEARIREAEDRARAADAKSREATSRSLSAERQALEAEQRWAQAEARASSAETNTDVLAGLTHEVRTPLNASMGSLQVLLGTPLAPDQRRLVETSVAASDQLFRVLEELSDHKSLATDALPVHRVGFRVRDLIDEIRSWREALATAQDLSWTIQVDPSVPDLLEGDPDRIRQVLYRLVDNAFAHTTEGGIRVQVRVDANTVRFSVSDTGAGFGDEAHVSGWPTRADHLDVSGRLGVGLSVCRRIVETMGGDVGAVGSEGVGATFWFRLPLVHATTSTVDVREVTLSRHRLPHGLRVLLVEDNPVNRMVAERLLSQLGCIVKVAADGMEAVQGWQLAEPDVILMDVHMPVLDGLEATRVIRAEEVDSRVPIVAVTADADADQREACLSAGMDEHITKPFRADDLCKALLRVLASKGAQRAVA